MNNKILIIGQALPAIKQEYPYDSTLLYEWFNEIGISKIEAQDIFEFDAVYGGFPGYDNFGNHLKPTFEQMLNYWNNNLKDKFNNFKKIIILGNVAKEFLFNIIDKNNENILCLIHPSKRNIKIYKENKEKIIKSLKDFIF